MIYPCLVPKSLCKTPVFVTVYGEGITEDGSPIVAFKGDLKCNYQDRAKVILTNEQKRVEITGSALFCGDICPDVAVISDGIVKIFGVERKILKGTKARNPDGTVNYTKLELI